MNRPDMGAMRHGDHVQWRRGRVLATRDLTADIRLIELEPGGSFPAPVPGSHIKVAIEIDGRPEIRSYSLVGPASDRLCRIAVKRLPDSRGGSAHMWTLAPGAPLLHTEPRNHFLLTTGRPEYLLVAGGVGITPIYGMALALHQRGAAFRVLYACRSLADAALADELAAVIGDRLQLHPSETGRRIDLPAAIRALALDAELYVCGPMPLLDAARRAWRDSGRAPQNLRFETFGSSGHHPAEPFLVTIPRLGREILVRRDQTMLDALEGAGIEMIHDCRCGECGLCALDVIEADGVVDHRDVFFSDEQKAANRKICTCVSRMAKGSIVLEIPDRAS